MIEMNQEREKKVATAAASLYVSNIITLLLNTFFIVYVTNLLPVSDFGLFSLLNIIVIITATISVFALPITGGSIIGTPPAVTRFLPDFRLYPSSARRLILTSLGISLLISVFSSFIVGGTDFFGSIAPPGQRIALDYAAVDCVAYTLAQLGAYSLIGVGRATTSSKIIVISNIFRYSFPILLLSLGYGVAGIFLGFAAGDFILAFTGLALSLRSSYGSGYTKMNPSRIFFYSLSVFVVSLTGLAVTQLDKILAYLGKGLESLGIYNVAVIGASIVSFAPSAIINALVSYIPVYEKNEIPNLIKTYTRYVSILTSPLGFCLASVSPYLLTLFGPSYSQGAGVLAIVAITLSVTSVSSVFASGLLVSDNSYYFALSNMFGVFLLIISSYLTIPLFGILGIAFGRSAMLVSSFLLIYLFASRKRIAYSDWRTFTKSIIASIIMFLLLFSSSYFLFSYVSLPRFVVVAISFAGILLGLVFYLFELKLMHILKEEDVEFLRRILPERLLWVADFLKKFT
jgi:stage V sporulation protein B